ncbi:GAF domain-like protein [Phlyctochytrium arcticum]|nr:GAF domain-like protein [Phlyctochytrium arcticum]
MHARTTYPTEIPAFYALIHEQTAALLDADLPDTSNFANIAALLYWAFRDVGRDINWVGWYFYKPETPGVPRKDVLYLGPFQGRVACTAIPTSKGVVGRAAKTRKAVLVEDVLADPNHIACDSASRSEIVVPITTSTIGQEEQQRCFGVLDVDCESVGGLSQEDVKGLQEVVRLVTEGLFATKS